ncbi:MAG: hypothetical protein RR744_00705 [Cellulosilyticaceae bacterium]
MEDISYMMVGLLILLFAVTVGEDIWNKGRYPKKINEYISIGISRKNKIAMISWIIVMIVCMCSDRDIDIKVFWIGLSILFIYEYAKQDIIFDEGIGEKSLLGIRICKIKWEQVETYKRTYKDEIVMEYIKLYRISSNKKNKKYSMYSAEKKIDLFYEELGKYIKEKELS